MKDATADRDDRGAASSGNFEKGKRSAIKTMREIYQIQQRSR